jgi:hypothetical protein
MKIINIIFLLLAILLMLGGCNDNEVVEKEKDYGSISGRMGEQIDLNLVFRSIDPNDKVNWSSSHEKVATVDERGMVICKGYGRTVVKRSTETNTIDRVAVFIWKGDPPNYNIWIYDFLRVRILSDEEYNQYMREYHNRPKRNYDYLDVWDAGKEYKLVYAEVMECYNNTQSSYYIYSVGQIASFAIPKDMYDIYKDYDQIVFWADRAQVETNHPWGRLTNTYIDMIMRDYDDLSEFNNGLAIKDNVVNISDFLDLGIDVNKSALFRVKYNYSTVDNPLIIEDGTTIEELTEMFNYMVNVKWYDLG